MVRRILIVADTDPIITATIEQLMQEQYQILIAADLTEMMQHLCQESDHIAALLIDAAHPDMIRCRMLRKIRQHTQFTDIPIIILSSAPHEAEEETALGYGASEYMRKPFSPGVFKQRLAHLLAPTYRTRLFYPEECDPTTGLLTQEAFYVKAERLMRENPNIVFHIVCMTIENMKQIKKIHCQAKCDKLLAHLAFLLSEIFCSGYCVLGYCRDNRFWLCLPHHEAQINADLVAVRTKLSYYPLEPEARLCCGINMADDTSFPIAELCGNAAEAMQHCSKYHLFCISYREMMAFEKEQFFSTSAECAAHNHDFSLLLHPFFHLHDLYLCGANANCIWHSHRFGDIPKNVLFSQMQPSGSHIEIDMHYLALVCEFVSGCFFARIPIPRLHLFLATQTLLLPNCTELILNILRPTGLKPSQFAVVIPLHEYLSNRAYFEHTVSALQKAGFSIIYSQHSIHTVDPRYAIIPQADSILLDLSALRSSDDFHAQTAVLNAAVHGAKQMQCMLYAANVTSREEASFLRSIGCTAAEGTYFSQPKDPETFVQTYGEHTNKAEISLPSILSQSDIWDPAAPFNTVFDSTPGAQLLAEVKKDTILPIRANDTFFRRFCPNTDAFALCTQSMQSYILPSQRDVLLIACHTAKQSGTEQNLPLTIRSFDGSDIYKHTHASIRLICRTANSYVVQIAFQEIAADQQTELNRRTKRRKAAKESEEDEYVTDFLTMCSISGK